MSTAYTNDWPAPGERIELDRVPLDRPEAVRFVLGLIIGECAHPVATLRILQERGSEGPFMPEGPPFESRRNDG